MSELFVQRVSAFVVALCLVVLVGTTALVVSPSLRQWTGVGPQVQPLAYAPGDQVDIEAATYQGAPLSLVLFARSTCAACQRGADFHRQAVAAARAQGVPTVLVTPSADAEAERAYAAGLGIAATHVYLAPAGSIKLRSVPALMVLDSSGRIRHVWFGASDAAAQATILSTVAALTRERVQ